MQAHLRVKALIDGKLQVAVVKGWQNTETAKHTFDVWPGHQKLTVITADSEEHVIPRSDIRLLEEH